MIPKSQWNVFAQSKTFHNNSSYSQYFSASCQHRQHLIISIAFVKRFSRLALFFCERCITTLNTSLALIITVATTFHRSLWFSSFVQSGIETWMTTWLHQDRWFDQQTAGRGCVHTPRGLPHFTVQCYSVIVWRLVRKLGFIHNILRLLKDFIFFTARAGYPQFCNGRMVATGSVVFTSE